MVWFKLTAPNGDPVQVSGDQIVPIRVPIEGVPGPAAKAIVDLTNGQSQATLEPPDQILDRIAGKTVPEETAEPVATAALVGATAPPRQATRRKK